MNEGYADLIQKVNSIIDGIAPVKEMCIKNNTFEAISVRDKKYKRFKRTRLHVDHVNYRKTRNQVKNLIKRTKRNYIKEKLTKKIGNSK